MESKKVILKQSLDDISALGYELLNVTAEAKAGYAFQEEAGSGIDWGSIAHMAVEYACRNLSYYFKHETTEDKDDYSNAFERLKVLCKKWLQENGSGEKGYNKLMQLVEKFIESPLFERIANSEERYCEVPFAVKSGKRIINGVMDLVFKEDDGWVIVDYKTDDFESITDRKSVYLKQVELYKKYWEEITGQAVSETLLYKI